MAELADAQASGACGRKIVWVQVPSPAFHTKLLILMGQQFFYFQYVKCLWYLLRTLFFYGRIQEYWGQISLPPLHY